MKAVESEIEIESRDVVMMTNDRSSGTSLPSASASASASASVPAIDNCRSTDTYLTYEEKCKWPRGFLSTSNNNSSFALVPGFQNVFPQLKQYMDDINYSKKRTSTRAIPPPELALDDLVKPKLNPSLTSTPTANYGYGQTMSTVVDSAKTTPTGRKTKRILLQEGDYLIYHPTMVTKLVPNKGINPYDHGYGLKVMFFDPSSRGFSGFDYRARRMAVAHSYVNNDERVFGQTFFLKRRGTTFLIPGAFEPKMNPILYTRAFELCNAEPESHQRKRWRWGDEDDDEDEDEDENEDEKYRPGRERWTETDREELRHNDNTPRVNNILLFYSRNIIDRHYGINE
jgi:hypothetical protein